MSEHRRPNFERPLNQPKIDLNEVTMNPLLKRMIKKMNAESFMIEEQNILIRLEHYKQKKGFFDSEDNQATE